MTDDSSSLLSPSRKKKKYWRTWRNKSKRIKKSLRKRKHQMRCKLVEIGREISQNR